MQSTKNTSSSPSVDVAIADEAGGVAVVRQLIAQFPRVEFYVGAGAKRGMPAFEGDDDISPLLWSLTAKALQAKLRAYKAAGMKVKVSGKKADMVARVKQCMAEGGGGGGSGGTAAAAAGAHRPADADSDWEDSYPDGDDAATSAADAHEDGDVDEEFENVMSDGDVAHEEGEEEEEEEEEVE